MDILMRKLLVVNFNAINWFLGCGDSDSKNNKLELLPLIEMTDAEFYETFDDLLAIKRSFYQYKIDQLSEEQIKDRRNTALKTSFENSRRFALDTLPEEYSKM